MSFIDTHTHLTSEEYINNLEEELRLNHEAHVNTFFICGFDLDSSIKALELAHKYEGCYAIIGFHPTEIKGYSDREYNWLLEHATDEKVVAIGEIGFDYHWDNTTKEEQREAFLRQIEIAKKVGKPISIHAREADQDTFDVLKKYYNSPLGGVLHAYSGSLELAKEYIKMNFVFGVGGVVTFKNARRLVEVIDGLSLDYFITETDSPYLSPTPHRGETNHSYYIPLIVNKIAEIKGVKSADVEDAVKGNVKRIFNVNYD